LQVTLALADIPYTGTWGGGKKAQTLRREVLNICLKIFGPEDIETAAPRKRQTGRRAVPTIQQGHYTEEAREVQTEAFHGLKKKCGLQNEDTLNAMDNLHSPHNSQILWA
jgi:hypothetical protein